MSCSTFCKKSLLICLFNYYLYAQAQVGGVIINQNNKFYTVGPASIVSDSIGKVYVYEEWTKLFTTGDYAISFIDSGAPYNRFRIIKMNAQQRRYYYASSTKPEQTHLFDSGAKMPWFRARDMNNTMVDTRKLTGKILVVNFWFIACPSCRKEIPSLNKLADAYANDTGIVFLSVALDAARPLSKFVEKQPVSFRLLHSGNAAAQRCGIYIYPTNIIVNRAGEVVYHTHRTGPVADYWLEKTIEQLKQQDIEVANP